MVDRLRSRVQFIIVRGWGIQGPSKQIELCLRLFFISGGQSAHLVSFHTLQNRKINASKDVYAVGLLQTC